MNDKKKSFIAFVSQFVLREWLQGLFTQSKSENEVARLLEETKIWIVLYLQSNELLKRANIAAKILEKRKKAYLIDVSRASSLQDLMWAESLCERMGKKLKINEVAIKKARNEILELLVAIIDKNRDIIDQKNVKILPEAYYCVKAVKAYNLAQQEIISLIPSSLYFFQLKRDDAVSAFFKKARELVDFYFKD